MIGKQIPVAGGIDVTFLEPLGVVGVIVPWNFPMTIAAWGFAPALAAGNAVLLKPAEWTPLTAIRLGELALESGLPEGLFQVLPGRGSVVGERFVTHEQVRKIVFTGSTEVGKKVMAGCAEQVKAVTLELGGKSANVVFADSDLEKAAAHRAVRGVRERRPGLLRAQPHPRRARVSTTASSSCSSRPCKAFASATRATRRPRWARSSRRRTSTRSRRTSTSRTSRLPRQRARRRRLLVRADGDAAAVATTAGRVDEIFGPVVTVLPFDDEADAIALANDTDLRALRLDLDARPRPRHPRRAGHRERQPLGQLALERALLDPVRRLQAERASAASSARTRRSPSPRPRTSSFS